MPFVKLDCGLLDSSLWVSESPETRCVWIALLAMCEADGMVRAQVRAIARRAAISEEATKKAVEIFLSPDPHSRTMDKEGRRLEKVDGGYQIINYLRYRSQGRVDTGGRPGSNPSDYQTQGKIYFILSGGFIKIGFSQNPWARLSALKTAMPSEPKLLGHIAGTMETEKRIQEQFKHLRSEREWFRATDEILKWITTNTTGRATVDYGSTEVEVEKETTSFNAKGCLVARDPAAPALGTAGPTAPCLEKKATELQQQKQPTEAAPERPIASVPAKPAEVKQQKPPQDTPRQRNAPTVAFPLKRRAIQPDAFERWNIFGAVLRGQGWPEEHVRRIVKWAARDYRSGAWAHAPAEVCWKVLGWAAYVRLNASRTDGKGQHVDDAVAFLVSLAAQPRPPQELFLKQARRAWERAEEDRETAPPAWLAAALEGIGNGPGARPATQTNAIGAGAAAAGAAAGAG